VSALAWNSSTLQVCVSTATGFVNIASASGGSSQWLNGASGAIYYNGGNVGIGTTNPLYDLTLSRADPSPVLLVANTDSTANRFPGISIANYRGATDKPGNPASL
jgi:hypothetical protein